MGGVLINNRWGSGCTCGLCPWCSSGKVGAYAKLKFTTEYFGQLDTEARKLRFL